MATELLERDELLVRLSSTDMPTRWNAVMTAAKRLKATPPPERARALGQRLFELVEDPEWKVREEVAWALVHYPGEEASTQLQILASDSVSQVARTAKQALKDRRRAKKREDRESERVARVLRRVQRLESQCSFNVAKEIEEVGVAYYQQIAFGCSHDVLNLMRAIQACLGELRGELEQRRVAKSAYAEILERVDRRAQIAREIALHMRSLTRQAVPAVRRIAVYKVVEEALSDVQDRCAEGGSEPEVDLTVSVPKHLQVEVPRDRLLQALTNLLQNAFEALRERGRVAVSAELEERHVVLTIEDTGRGIRPEVQPLVFFPGKSTKKGRLGRDHNMGWGLSLARKFVEEDCRGELTLESDYGVGTTVTLHLPLRRPEVEE